MRKLLATLALSVLAVAPLAASAGTPVTQPAYQGKANGSFNVGISVFPDCNVTSASDIVFGATDALLGGTKTGQSTIATQCQATTATLGFFDSTGAKGSSVFTMSDGASHTLPFSLCSDSACANKYAQGEYPTTISNNGNGSYTVYAQTVVPANTIPAAYNDTVTAVISFQ